jgi:hypothetical protein
MLLIEAIISVLAVYGVMLTRTIMHLSEEEEEDDEDSEVVTHSYR